jgi:hypothetical protein
VILKAQSAFFSALGHQNYTFRCIALVHICNKKTLIILVLCYSFPFPTCKGAPGFLYCFWPVRGGCSQNRYRRL